MDQHADRIIQGGECGELIRSHDWAKTAMGPIDTWPVELLGVINSMLNSPIAVVLMCGSEGNLIYNDGYAEFAAEKHPEIIGQPFAEAWPEVAEYNQDIYNRIKAGEHISYQDMELQLTRKGQPETLYLDLHYGPIFAGNGSFCGVQVWVFETTDRVIARAAEKQAKEILLQERKQLQALFNDAPAYIAILKGPEHIFEFANPGYLRIIGNRDIVGKTMREVVPELEGQGVYELLDEVYGTAKPFVGKEIERELDIAGTGLLQTVYLNVMYLPRYDEKHEIEGIMVYASDVTDFVLARQKAEEVSALNRAITDNSATALFIMDADGVCTFMNPSAEQMTGLQYRTTIGHSKLIGDMFICEHILGDKPEKCLLSQAMRTGKSTAGEERLRNTAGHEFSAAFSVNPIKTDGSNSVLVEIRDISQEITARVEQERLKLVTMERNELRKLNQSKDEFIGMASHQLRTPATAVKQFTSLLIGNYGGELSEEQRDFAQKAYDSNERQLNIINDMLKIAQIDSNRYSLRQEHMTVEKLVGRVVAEMESTFAGRNQSLVVENVAPATEVYIDPSEMNLVLMNLLENASKYSPAGTTIRLDAATKGKSVVFSVTDQGVGIGRDDMKRIFQKFTRVDNELSDTVNGTGLGLYLANQIVKFHNGSITVDSRLGKGSRFTVKLPYGR